MQVDDDAKYLLEPPDSPQTIAPVTVAALQVLPTDQLLPRNMERLALRLGEKEGDAEYAAIYGVPGQKQDGIDVLFRLADGTYRLIQSRRIREIKAAGLRDAVTDFLDGKWAAKASSFVYATSASAADTTVQDEIVKQAARLKKVNIAFDVWDDDRISRKLDGHPDLVLKFFGPDVLRVFLPGQAGPLLAQEILDGLAPKIASQFSSAARGELQSLALGGGLAQPDAAEGLLDMVLMSGDLAPDVREVLDELRKTSRTEAQQLASYVRDDPRRARDLIADPQGWVSRGSWQLYNALGLLSNAAGHYAAAGTAFVEGQNRSPAPDRPLLLMRARDAAENDDRPDDAATLFERARELNDQLIAVRIVEILKTGSPEQQLNHLRQLKPADDREQTAVDRAQIDVLLDLERPGDTLPLLSAMLTRVPDSIFALDRRAGVTFRQAAGGANVRPERDPGVLRQAADDSLMLRDLVLPRERTLEAGRLLARAAECLTLAGDREAAHGVLDQVTDAELAQHEVRTGVAQALLHTGDVVAARTTLGDEAQWDNSDRLVAAHTFAVGNDHDEHLRAISIAEPLLDGELRVPAALAMVISAAFDIAVAWPEGASDILFAAVPAAGAHFRAERLTVEGQPEEAERLLQKHADDPDILRALVERAYQAENWGRGLALAERLARDTGRGEDRLLLAGILDGAGKTDRLNQQLNAIIANADEPPRVRSRAYAALSAAVAPEDYAALDDLTERWTRDLPDDHEGLWQRVHALARLGRYEPALAILEGKHLEAPTINHARLTAAVFVRALKPLDAARRIAQLSDQFNREDEGLEALVLFAGTRTKDQADEELKTRIAETLKTFPERFPESTAIRAVSVDETDPESILDVIRAQFDPEHERQRREMLDAVSDGSAAVAYLGATISRRVPQVMLRLAQVPLAYGDRDEWVRELVLARNAIGNPAVWDPTSLTIAAAMPKPVAAAVNGALPGSLVAYSSLLECDKADGAMDDRDEEESITQDGEGFRIHVVGREALERERAVIKGAFELARTLTVAPNVAADEPDELDDFFKEHNDDSETQFDTFPATISVARRRGLPIYSDDRYVRQMAHQARIETFGSVALVTALAEHEAISQGSLTAFRLELLRNGAVGLRPKGGELAELSSENNDEPAAWTAAILDPSAWHNDADEHLRQCVVFLSHVWERRPDLFDLWVARVLDAIGRAVPKREAFFASVALVYLWFLLDIYDKDDRQQRAFSSALIAAFMAAPAKLGVAAFPNLLGDAIDIALRFGVNQANAKMTRWILITIVRQLRFPLDAEALAVYWNRV